LIYSSSDADQGAKSDADSDGSLDSDASSKRNLCEVVNAARPKLTRKGDARRRNARRRGKASNTRRMKHGFETDPEKFGDLVTVGHIRTRDWRCEPGSEATRMLLPRRSWRLKDSVDVFVSVNFTMGDQPIKKIYSDNSESYRNACFEFKVRRGSSQPNKNQSNGFIEQVALGDEEMTRCALLEVGLPSCFRTHATPCSFRLRNMFLDRETVGSPCYKRRSVKFKEHAVPFGRGVFYKSKNLSEQPSKMGLLFFTMRVWGVGWARGAKNLISILLVASMTLSARNCIAEHLVRSFATSRLMRLESLSSTARVVLISHAKLLTKMAISHWQVELRAAITRLTFATLSTNAR
jgi:hypothetical protein